MSSGTHHGALRGHGLDRILQIRRRAYLFLMSTMAGLGAAQIFLRRPTVAPFYFPVGPVVITVLVAALIRTVLGTVFGQIELAKIERRGRDRAAERIAMRRPAVFALIFGLAALALVLPAVHGALVAFMTQATDRSLAAGASSAIPGGLISVDAAGLTRVTRFNISNVTGAVEVGISDGGRTVLQILITAGESWSWTPDGSRRIVYNVTLSNPSATASQFRVTIVRDAFTELWGIVPAALVLVAMANLVSLFRLHFYATHYWDAATVMRRAEHPVPADRHRYGIEEAPPRPQGSFLNLPTRPQGKVPAAKGRRREPAVVLLHQAPVAKPARAKRPPARPAPEIVPEAVLREAAVREAKGDLKGALARYDLILHRKPGHPAASLAKATVLRRLNRAADALGVYRELLHKDRDNLAALRGCLAIHEADEAWRDALDIVDRILALRPDDAYVHATQGDILVALRRQPEAVAAYARATALRPKDAALVARANRARTDISLLLSHAFLASGSGDLQAALAAFDDVLRVEEDNLDARVGKSSVLRRLGDVREARTLLEEVLARDPRHSAALLTKAQVAAESGDLRASLATLSRLLRVVPGDPEALLERGDLLARMGRAREARADYEAALRLHPDDADATEKLRALAGGDKADRAVLRELFRVRGLASAKAQAILAAGYRTVDDLRRADVERLAAVPGVGRNLAEAIVHHARQQRRVQAVAAPKSDVVARRGTKL